VVRLEAKNLTPSGFLEKILRRDENILNIEEFYLQEHRLRVFENWALRGIFGPKRDEVIGGWRKLHNEDLHNMY
jgi:hypothetical protein